MNANIAVPTGPGADALPGGPALALAGESVAPLTLRREAFGYTPDGTPVHRWTFGCPGGVTAAVLTYGAILQSCRVPDRDGVPGEVVLGLRTLADYAADEAYLGAVVGRYANRIAGGRFTLDGTEYRLPANDRGNTLHGGPDGFHRRVWSSAGLLGGDRVGVRLRLLSPDGDMGFPGALRVEVSYTIDQFGTLAVEYRASTDRPTVLNLTQHAYWNLAGGGKIGTHTLDVAADTYLPVDPYGVPHGPAEPVAGTPFALRGQALAEVLGPAESPHPQAGSPDGLDHCFVLRGTGPAPEGRAPLPETETETEAEAEAEAEADAAPRYAARLAEPRSGRVLEVATTEPGLQIYTANGPTPPFGCHSAVCLETQHFPNAPNRPEYPSTVLRPGQFHRSTTHYRFTHLPIGSRAHGGPARSALSAPE